MTLRDNWKQLASGLIDQLDYDTESVHKLLRKYLKETKNYSEFYEKANLLISEICIKEDDGVFDYPYTQFLFGLDENCLLEEV